MGIKLTITTLILGWFLTGCGLSSDTSQIFTIEMMGTNVAPASATGDTTPQWQEYSLTGVTFVAAAGGEASSLFDDAAEPKTGKIVNRPQIIFTKDVTDLAGNSYSAVTLTFATTVTGGSSESQDHSVALSSGTVTLTEDFEVEEGKDSTLMVKVNWMNTVSGDTMSEPELTLSFP